MLFATQQDTLAWHLDNERVPGNHVLLLEEPGLASQDPIGSTFMSKPEIDRVFRFDLTETDAIVVGE